MMNKYPYHGRKVAAVAISCILTLASGSASSQLGIALGAAAEQMRRMDEIDNYKKALELEEQRLKLLEQQQQMEIQRERRAREAREQRLREEQQAREEVERRDKQAELAAYRAGFMGTGFVVSKKGHIITNAHVIGDYRYIIAKDAQGTIYEADVIATNKQIDLALLQVSKKSDGLPIVKGNSPLKGSKVFAIGFPQPTIQGTESKITDGIISSNTGLRNDNSSYQISVPIQGGNSGGPLLTENGEVVGVVVATVNAKRFLSMTGDIPQNINFAIKSEVLEDFLKVNGINPLRQTKATKNGLVIGDSNTVLVAAKPEPFNERVVKAPSTGATEVKLKQESVKLVSVVQETQPTKKTVEPVPTPSKSSSRLPTSHVASYCTIPSNIGETVRKINSDANAAFSEGLNLLAEFKLGEAVPYLQTASNLGHAGASNRLYLIFLNGSGVPKNETTAQYYLVKAADQGEVNAQILVGGAYQIGNRGLPKNESKATQYFRQAAIQGNAQGQYLLGLASEDGAGGCPKNIELAAAWYRFATEQGHRAAKSRLDYLTTN